MSKNRDLFDLVGFKARRGYGRYHHEIHRKKPPGYDTDLNAMREVWWVLKERGLWRRFMDTLWDTTDFGPRDAWTDELYIMLNDLPGHIKAAIQVLKEAQVEYCKTHHELPGQGEKGR